ncbi:universal stress family protein [Peptostreptococcaceae bacterium oral taxon 113 str. W5053]|nr:universal stress family protein [Peptostreptococcaceae bacterium oral taxon 113 str. W5053]
MKDFKILLPVDGSEGSRQAIEMAKEMAKKFDAHIILFNSADIRPQASAHYAYDNIIVDAMKKNSDLIICDAEKELKDFDVESVKVIGRAGDKIVDYCENNPVNLIIMATRGIGAVERFFVGSVTTYVLHHSPVPVLAIPVR